MIFMRSKMDLKKATLENYDELIDILTEYKHSIFESPFTQEQLNSLQNAIANESIFFFLASIDGDFVGVCSSTIGFSTFKCARIGVVEDFFILPEYRRRGIGRKLANYVFSEMEEMGIDSLWVGCADIDVEKFKKLGFNIGLGNLLTWSSERIIT